MTLEKNRTKKQLLHHNCKSIYFKGPLSALPEERNSLDPRKGDFQPFHRAIRPRDGNNMLPVRRAWNQPGLAWESALRGNQSPARGSARKFQKHTPEVFDDPTSTPQTQDMAIASGANKISFRIQGLPPFRWRASQPTAALAIPSCPPSKIVTRAGPAFLLKSTTFSP